MSLPAIPSKNRENRPAPAGHRRVQVGSGSVVVKDDADWVMIRTHGGTVTAIASGPAPSGTDTNGNAWAVANVDELKKLWTMNGKKRMLEHLQSPGVTLHWIKGR